MHVGWRRRRSGETAAGRRTRITYRCLYIDLHEDLPPPEVDIGAIDHPIMAKAREFASTHPANQVRIQEIRDTMVYRFTHGRDRVATWLDRETGVMWVCAVDERDEETYDFFVDLHADGELLPSREDELREAVEAAAQFSAAVQAGVPEWLKQAREQPSTEHIFELPGWVTIRIFVRPGDVEEIWIAMPTLNAPAGLMPRMRGLILATAQQSVPEGEWEQRYDWPTGQLLDYEIAHLGLSG